MKLCKLFYSVKIFQYKCDIIYISYKRCTQTNGIIMTNLEELYHLAQDIKNVHFKVSE